MNLIKQRVLLKKCYRSIVKYCTSTTSSALQNSRETHINGLFQTRLRIFLEENDKKNDKINKSMENTEYETQIFRKNSSLEYDQLIDFIDKRLTEKHTKETDLKIADQRSCALLRSLSKIQILKLLHQLAKTGTDLTKLKIYGISLIALRRLLERRNLTTSETLQLLFFESLAKKLARRRVKYLLNFLPPPDELSLMEKCSIAYTTFKCSVKLKSNVVETLEKTMENNATELIKDSILLSTICKAIRKSGTSKNFTLDNLSREIINYDNDISITSAVHILSLYCEANQENSLVTKKLLSYSVKTIVDSKEKFRFGSIRIKDIDRLLWALSVLNYELSESDKTEIIEFVNKTYREFQTQPAMLVNTLLSLWILDCKLYNIVQKCLTYKVFQQVNDQKDLWKPIARLQLLLNCIKIEAVDIKLPDELFQSKKVGMKFNKSVMNLHRMIDELKNEFNFHELIIDCPVNGIYIDGVTLRADDKLIHIDLINETTCFKNTNNPHGLLQLKIRLLKKIGFRSVLITENQAKDVKFVSSAIAGCIEDESTMRQSQ